MVKILVIYAGFSFGSSYNFFMNHGYYPNDPTDDFQTDFHIVNSNSKIDTHTLQYFTADNLFYHTRENIGYDFAAWSHVLFLNDNYLKYDYFILLNDSCCGPFIPVYCSIKWTQLCYQMLNDRTKLVGVAINYHYGQPHVQSYFMCTDHIGIKLGYAHGILSPRLVELYRHVDFSLYENKYKMMIEKHEIGFSQVLLSQGYCLQSFMKATDQINFAECQGQHQINTPYGMLIKDMQFQNSGYFGKPYSPYEMMFVKSNRDIDFGIYYKMHNRGRERYIVNRSYNYREYHAYMEVCEHYDQCLHNYYYQAMNIYEHVSTLYDYAKKSHRIAILADSDLSYLWVFVKGLIDNPKAQKSLIVYHPHYQNDRLIEILELFEIECCIVDLDHFSGAIPQEIPTVDLLFINTWHVYARLIRELNAFEDNTKWIIMHNTDIDKARGESVRMNHDIKSLAMTSGYPESEICTGMQSAIQEFLQKTSYKIHEEYQHQYGLTILQQL